MKYKSFANFRWLALVVFIVTVAISSCSKTDKTYYHYTNNLATFNGNAVVYLQSQPAGIYDSMLLVINRLTGIKDTLSSGNITLFAVSNNSFSLALQNINQARMDSVPQMPPVSFSTIDSAVLDTFFCRYIIQGQHLSDSLVGFTDGLLFPSIRYNYNMQMQFIRTNASGFLGGGPKAIIFSDPKNSIFTRNWIRVNTVTVDIKTKNAVIDVLPPGHDFGFGDDFIKSANFR
ncbi:MAG: hypothetical protein JSU03_05285 [Bacteroidetes bacterium]|nr:hypothetical protein [Bacteroidota bacterium]MBS1756671.1 hypothetical protein [Bacteroidota bacterium]